MASCPVCEKTYDDHLASCPVDGATLLRDGPPVDPFLGLVIRGRYRVLQKLGQGGMGSVYLAEQMAVSRNVALKVVHGDFARDAEFVKRFRLEARLAASLNHRNVVTIYDFDQAEDGSLFIAMEYLNGRTLAEVVRQEGACAVGRAIGLSLQIAQGLEAAHTAGVIHRDIKPQNIMVLNGEDQIKLMDFGIARLSDVRGQGLTRTGVVMGTPAYMSPEQIEGGEITRQTDIYAFGIVLYELLTGTVPFAAATASAVFVQQLREPPRPVRSLNAKIPEAVDRVVLQALEKNPEARPRSMAAVIAELSAASTYVTHTGSSPTADSGATVVDLRSLEGQTVAAAYPQTMLTGTASLPTIAVSAEDASSNLAGAARPVGAKRRPVIKAWKFGVVLFVLAGVAATVHFSGIGLPGKPKGIQTAAAPTSPENPVVQEPEPAPAARQEPVRQLERFQPEGDKQEPTVRRQSGDDGSRPGDNVLKLQAERDKAERDKMQKLQAERDTVQKLQAERDRMQKPQPENMQVAVGLRTEDSKRAKDDLERPREPNTKQPGQETKPGQDVVSAVPGSDEIRRQVEQKLRASGFEKLAVKIDPDNTVTLLGGLETQELREEARRLARSVGGVRDVKDIIILTPAGTTKKIR